MSCYSWTELNVHFIWGPDFTAYQKICRTDSCWHCPAFMWETKDSKIQSLYCLCLNEIRTYKWLWPKAVRIMLWPALWSSQDNDPQRKAKANVTLNWNWQESGHIDDGWWWEQAQRWGAWHRQTWELSLAASGGVWARVQPLSGVPCLSMKVNSMENPSEKGHHKSYIIVEMQRLHIWNSLISSGTLCYYQLGWKNWNLPPQLSLPLCVSKISTPGIPQLLSHNEELLLWLKG